MDTVEINTKAAFKHGYDTAMRDVFMGGILIIIVLVGVWLI